MTRRAPSLAWSSIKAIWDIEHRRGIQQRHTKFTWNASCSMVSWRETRMAWRKKRDPLFRGDAAAGVAHPDPGADASIVAHILYLDGAGRSTPYQSTTESEEVARHFAGARGRIYETRATDAEARSVGHVSRFELVRLLRGKGQGRAKWSSALEVMQARRYVEMWSEHLLDFRQVPKEDVPVVIAELYKP